MKITPNNSEQTIPKVSIIILNWNTTEVTCQLLQSLKNNLTYSNIEIIIVDNGSKIDPSYNFLSIIPDLKIVLNPDNYGFSAGCNIGMKLSTGDYIFLLNSDTEITRGLIETMVEPFLLDNTIGIISPRVHSFKNKNLVEYLGYSKIHPITGRSKILNSYDTHSVQENGLLLTEFAYGAAMMISRKVLNQVGGLCEDYFAYYEELDWSNRIKEKGYKVYCNPKALVFHKGSVSTMKISPFKTFLMTRNRVLFMKRNVNKINYKLFIFYFLFLVTPKQIITYIVKFQFNNINAFFSGINYHLFAKKTYSFKIYGKEVILLKSLS